MPAFDVPGEFVAVHSPDMGSTWGRPKGHCNVKVTSSKLAARLQVGPPRAGTCQKNGNALDTCCTPWSPVPTPGEAFIDRLSGENAIFVDEGKTYAGGENEPCVLCFLNISGCFHFTNGVVPPKRGQYSVT